MYQNVFVHNAPNTLSKSHHLHICVILPPNKPYYLVAQDMLVFILPYYMMHVEQKVKGFVCNNAQGQGGTFMRSRQHVTDKRPSLFSSDDCPSHTLTN